jgi:hypothetical protein
LKIAQPALSEERREAWQLDISNICVLLHKPNRSEGEENPFFYLTNPDIDSQDAG